MAVQSKNNDKIDNRLYKEKINYYLNKRKWSIFELSQQADISAATIYEWYHNKKRPSLTNITKICEAFNITLAQFFSETSGEHVAANLSELFLSLIHISACRPDLTCRARWARLN